MLRTMEFERAANSMGLKRLIAEFLSIWKHQVKQPQLQPVCIMLEVQGNSENLFTKMNPRKNFAYLAYLGGLLENWLTLVQVTEARFVYLRVHGEKYCTNWWKNRACVDSHPYILPACTKPHPATFCSSSSLGEKPVTAHRCHHEELTGFNSNPCVPLLS